MSEKMTLVRGPDSPQAREAPAIGPGLLLHKFVKAESWRGALTPDPTGANLPLHGSAWIYEKEVIVSPSDRRAGATAVQIADGVSERGYFLLPIADDV